MTKDLTGTLDDLGELIVTNLNSKGISGISKSDGLTTLIGNILDITGSVEGIDLVTSVSCLSSSNVVDMLEEFTISGVLKGDYDDTGSDLRGFIKGGTVEIYNGETLLGSCVTDSNGEYSFDYTPLTDDDLTIKAVYNGSTYFDDCESSTVSVTVNPITVLSLSTDKEILSYYDEDTATISVSLIDGSMGLTDTVDYVIKDSNNSTVSSGSVNVTNGTGSISYSSIHSGEISVTATYDNNITDTINLLDAKYYASNTRIHNEAISNGTQNIFISTYNGFSSGDKVYFKFTTVPSHTLWGVGNRSTSDLVFEKNGTTYNYYRNPSNVSSYGSTGYGGGISDGYVTMIYKETSSSYSNKIGYIYKNILESDVSFDWWQMGSSANSIRVDIFPNDDFTIEVYVL